MLNDGTGQGKKAVQVDLCKTLLNEAQTTKIYKEQGKREDNMSAEASHCFGHIIQKGC